ncbi:Phosphate regulon transcriptional regulatory protein PhoB [Polaromonas vacuolata]|uniref:Phosphate regulon transcriptional regulatory protein PhoB n=1 Tax=Polaromonas vacuolata TaxID=37448 RepID=A0A6H2HCR8_9BURK|nr:response regulator [Polaromonas vacuolata]QJC57557.1 Phosphate regulon transcriptional regulatory protein PhoB [Polaromonas vacuolata]
MSAQRILLVEDDKDIRSIVQLALEHLGGYQVLACACGAQALAEAANFRPDLLLLDVSMPDMDGLETLAALRQQSALALVPVAFLTAHTAAKQVSQYRALNAVDVIAKPFDPHQLCERIRAILAKTATATTSVSAPANTDQARTDQARVALVVEDDPSIRYLLGFILAQQGWAMLEAHDGLQGKAAILGGPVVDAVLLDIMLPEIDGLQLLDILRSQRRWKDVPVMMLSASGDEPSVKRALVSGANDYLAKPFDPDDLIARLSRMHGLSSSAH